MRTGFTEVRKEIDAMQWAFKLWEIQEPQVLGGVGGEAPTQPLYPAICFCRARYSSPSPLAICEEVRE